MIVRKRHAAVQQHSVRARPDGRGSVAAAGRSGKMRILELIDDASIGGGQRHVLMLARGLQTAGHEVHVGCYGRGFLVDELQRSHIPVHPIGLGNRLSLSSLTGVVRLLREGRYDILHTHGGTAGFWGRCASMLVPGSARVHTYHGLHSIHRAERLRGRLYLWIDRLLARATDHTICVAESDLAAAKSHGLVVDGRASVVRNGIELDRFRNKQQRGTLRASLKLGRRDYVVGSIGRLDVQKGYVYLLEAVPLVLRVAPQALFMLVGDGPLREELEARALSLGISSRVWFAGARDDPERMLAAMDLFVLPSLWEGLPLVILEALAAGKPIVATRTTGTEELVRDGREAVLVPPRDSVALAEAILRLIRSSRLRRELVQNGSRHVRKGFTAERMVGEIIDVYAAAARTRKEAK